MIARETLEYRYQLPSGWSETVQEAPVALRELVLEIGRLLVELTGSIVIHRLEEIPELTASGLRFRLEETH